MNHKTYISLLHQAAREAEHGVSSGHGGPFGAIIVKDDEIIASAHNEVLKTNDPTAHAEILAIRAASQKLGRFNLSDCVLVSTCEPCPMCLAAVYWAGIKEVYFGCTRQDAADIGFQDNDLYDIFTGKADVSRLAMQQIGRETCLKAFDLWRNKEDKIRY